MLWSILRLPLRLGSRRLILWRITSGHVATTQLFSDLRCLALSSPQIMLILRVQLTLLILLGVVLAHSIVILGVLRLALFSLLITIVIEAIASAALRGIKRALKRVPEREGLRTWHRQVSSLCIIGRRWFGWEGLLSRRDAWTAVDLSHFILRVDLIYLGVLELQVRGGVRVGLLLSLSRPRARFLVPLLGLLRIFLSHRLLGLLSVELRGVHAITSARNARLKRVFCASDLMLSLRSFINHLLIIIKHGELITYVNNMMLNTQKERKRSTFTCHAILCYDSGEGFIDCKGRRHYSLSAG